MKYLLKLIFDNEITNNSDDIMSLMKKLGIDEIVSEINNRLELADSSEKKSKWVGLANEKLKNFNKYKFKVIIKTRSDEYIDIKLVRIKVNFSRYEKKIFLILILERMQSLVEVNFNELEIYDIRKLFKEIFGDEKIEVMVKHKSIEFNEYLTISNPTAVFEKHEREGIKDILESSYTEFESKDYFRYDKTKYLDKFYSSQDLKKPGNYLRVYESLYILDVDTDSALDRVLVDFHTQVLTFIRSNAFENELKEEFNILDKLDRIIKLIENIWPRIKIELSKMTMSNSALPQGEVKIFLNMIELSSSLYANIYKIDSKFQSYLLKYEERFERLEFNLDKAQRENYKEGLKENIYRYFNSINRKIDISKSSISDFQEQITNLRSDTDSHANFKLQIYMLILTVILTLWGIFTLLYDKATSIATIIEGIIPSAKVLFSMVAILGVISLFVYFLIKNLMYTHIRKEITKQIEYCTVKCDKTDKCSLEISDIYDKNKSSSKKNHSIFNTLEMLNLISILLLDYNSNCEEKIDNLIESLEKSEGIE